MQRLFGIRTASVFVLLDNVLSLLSLSGRINVKGPGQNLFIILFAISSKSTIFSKSSFEYPKTGNDFLFSRFLIL